MLKSGEVSGGYTSNSCALPCSPYYGHSLSFYPDLFNGLGFATNFLHLFLGIVCLPLIHKFYVHKFSKIFACLLLTTKCFTNMWIGERNIERQRDREKQTETKLHVPINSFSVFLFKSQREISHYIMIFTSVTRYEYLIDICTYMCINRYLSMHISIFADLQGRRCLSSHPYPQRNGDRRTVSVCVYYDCTYLFIL